MKEWNRWDVVSSMMAQCLTKGSSKLLREEKGWDWVARHRMVSCALLEQSPLNGWPRRVCPRTADAGMSYKRVLWAHSKEVMFMKGREGHCQAESLDQPHKTLYSYSITPSNARDTAHVSILYALHLWKLSKPTLSAQYSNIYYQHLRLFCLIYWPRACINLCWFAPRSLKVL